MCMGLGCNAVGVTGCRIIDSPRERAIAVVTNGFVPCNGRFPAMIVLITAFFADRGGSIVPAVMLTGMLALSVAVTFGVSALLSKTLLKGRPSAFTLELPPYRRPKFWSVLVRSVFDRTLFVLGRAVTVAAPAGLVIWLLANTSWGDGTLLTRAADLLSGPGTLMGMNGAILLAFILGFPANEIVLPIAVMTMVAGGRLTELGSAAELAVQLRAFGWTEITALCMMLFSMFHWPCSTTCLTIKKETGSLGLTLLAMALPTAVGAILCMAVHFIAELIIL